VKHSGSNPINQSRTSPIRTMGIVLSALSLTVALILLNSPMSVQAQGAVQLRLLQSDSDRIVLELEVSNYTVQSQKTDGKNYSIVTASGLDVAGLPGAPQLPIKGTMVGLPPGAQASLQILADDSRREILAAPVLSAPTGKGQYNPQTGAVINVAQSITPDSKIYTANQFYPSDTARVASVSNWRSQHVALVEFHPFQYNPVTQQLVFHNRIRIQINLTYPRGKTAAALGGTVNEGSFESVFQQNLLNYTSALDWRAPTNVPATSSRQPSVYSGGPWYKIGVNADGIYKITCTQLANAGINLGALDITTLKILKQGTELAINVAGSNWSICDSTKYLEFFGQAPNSKYTNTNIYWLTFGGVAGKRMGQRVGSGVNPINTYTDTLHLEQNKFYVSTTPLAENADHWFWTILFMSGLGSTDSADYPFQLNDPVTGGFSATLQAAFSGYDGIHHLQIAVNGNPIVASANWSGRNVYTATTTFPASYLNAGTNTLTVTGINDFNSYIDAIYVNSFDLNYQRAFTTTNDTLRLRQVDAGSWQFQANGFTNPQIEMYDITDPFSVTQVTTSTVSAGAFYTLQVSDVTTTPHQYLALTSAQVQSPASFVADISSDLHGTNGADYIIIAYHDFITTVLCPTPADYSLACLKKHRESVAGGGYRVKIVDVQDVYDEFSDGLVDAQAIRDFLQFTYNNWQSPKPSFVLLVGDGHFDFKGYCITPGNCPRITTPPNTVFIPPYMRMVDPWGGETDSDNRYVSFNDATGDTFPNMMIGRFPVNSTAEVDAMVAKTLANEPSSLSGAWRSVFTFVTDKAYIPNSNPPPAWIPEPAGPFWSLSDEVAGNSQYIHSGWTAERIYYNPCPSNFTSDGVSYPCNLSYPSYSDINVAHSAILSAINSGRLIVNYIGHGADVAWNSDNGTSLFQKTDVGTLTNSGKYPVFLDMTCLTGYFVYPGNASLEEVNVRTAGKGALASWSPTGQGLAQGHDFLDRGFFEALAQHGAGQLGVLTMAGQSYLWVNAGGGHRDLIDTFVVLGDPAARLQVINYSFLPFVRK
jgi:hypothetical protein